MTYVIEDGKITGYELTPAGMLRVFGVVAHTGWLQYGEKMQYVDAKVLFDPEHLKSIEAAIVTLHHPSEAISPQNAKTYAVGFTTDNVIVIAREESIAVELVIIEQNIINSILNKQITGLSMGYEVETEVIDINKERQIRRICNHIALTNNPRAENALINLDELLKQPVAVYYFPSFY